MKDQIKTVGVFGLGVMGFDIAFLYAMVNEKQTFYQNDQTHPWLLARAK